MHIPFFSLDVVHAEAHENLRRAFEKVLDQGVFVMGEELKEFERSFSTFNKVNFSAGVGSGYDALFLSLQALGLKPGDEIFVPAHTFVATWHAIYDSGLKIVPVDADLISCNINPDLLDQLKTSKTKAVLPVHMYGQVCDMDVVKGFCKKHDLYCIEDFAQAHGAMYKGQLAGSMGDINATSFYPVKNLGALGDGGLVTTNSESLHKKVLCMRNYGSSEKYYYEEVGINSRLDELQAAFLNVKLKFLKSHNDQRREIAAYYIEGLKDIKELILPVESKDCHHVYHLFVIRTTQRDKLKKYLSDHGIETAIHYPVPPHLQNAYRSLGFRKGDFPVTESISDTCLSLPCYPGMKMAQIEYVVEKGKRVF